MDRKALDKARHRLRLASKAAADLQSCATFDEFSGQWYFFLVSAKSVYTVLEQGVKLSPQSMQWFGGKQKDRRGDPLLQYLYEARNADEHGLGSSVDLQPEKHEIAVAAPGYSNTVRLDGGPFSNVVVSGTQTAVVFEGEGHPTGFRVTPLDGKPVLVRRTPASAILVDVVARGNRRYPPPKSHLGEAVSDTSPIGVAKLAISYLEGLLAEASALA